MSSVQRYEYFTSLTLSIVLVQTLAEILSEREMISHLMEKIIDEATRPWGVKVERVEIKVIILYQDNFVCQEKWSFLFTQ